MGAGSTREQRHMRQTRYIDHGKLLASFATTVIAVCPQCSGPALTRSASRYVVPFNAKDARVDCSRCSFGRVWPRQLRGTIKGEPVLPGDWFGPITGILKDRCPNCGFKWIRATIQKKELNNKTPKTKMVSCPSCNQRTTLPICWTINRFDGTAIDPIFGLPLWLRTNCVGNILWAYNQDHLRELTAYVKASLRERANSSHWSMFSRIPQWFKSAKNRESILRCLDRLNRRFLEAELPTRKDS